MKVDMVANMEVDKVDDMDVDMVPNMLVDKMADMKVFKVADTVAGMNFSMICSYFLVSFFWISWEIFLDFLVNCFGVTRLECPKARKTKSGSILGRGVCVRVGAFCGSGDPGGRPLEF